MKSFISKNSKLFLGLIIGIISVSIVYAATISSKNVTYKNSNLESEINDLYAEIKTKPLITAWTYNEDSSADNYCINGEETSCEKTDCYKSDKKCEMGTVIRYYVNDNEYRYFYVLNDNGTKITMQQRENTIRNIAWHAGANDNSYGPDTVLPALEQATSTWTNVDVLDYTPRTTLLYDKANVSCTYSTDNYKITCTNDPYTNSTLGTRKSRARMITVQEAGKAGCLVYRDGSIYTTPIPGQVSEYNYGSCPDYMHNYLYSSSDKSYGGTYDNNTPNEDNIYDRGYWTMSYFDGYSTVAWTVNLSGRLYDDYTSNNSHGARAVVEITKSNL